MKFNSVISCYGGRVFQDSEQSSYIDGGSLSVVTVSADTDSTITKKARGERRKLPPHIIPAILALAIHGVVFSISLPHQEPRSQELTIIPIEIVTQYSIDKPVADGNEAKLNPLDKPPKVSPHWITKEKKLPLTPALPKAEIDKKISPKIQPEQTTQKKEHIFNTTQNDSRPVHSPAPPLSNGASPVNPSQLLAPAATSVAAGQPQSVASVVQFRGAQQETVSHRQATTPAYLHNRQPEYPAVARERGQSGTVFIKVLVDAKGRVAELTITRSSGHGSLDRAALRAVENWLFSPAIDDGMAVAMWVTVPILFQLQGP